MSFTVQFFFFCKTTTGKKNLGVLDSENFLTTVTRRSTDQRKAEDTVGFSWTQAGQAGQWSMLLRLPYWFTTIDALRIAGFLVSNLHLLYGSTLSLSHSQEN